MQVDPERRILWALSFVSPPWPVPDSKETGWSGLFKYDLETGKLIKKYTLCEPGKTHLFNDLTISKHGDVFLTDTIEGTVYALFHDGDNLDVFLTSDKFMYPNGITLGEDDRVLYITSSGNGVYQIDVKTKQVKLISQPANISLCRIDGMYFYKNSLVCVQNGLHRIARFYLNPNGDSVKRMEIIETKNPHFILPTTGVIVDHMFYYIANSQAYSIHRDGTLFPPEKLKDVVILKADLK